MRQPGLQLRYHLYQHNQSQHEGVQGGLDAQGLKFFEAMLNVSDAAIKLLKTMLKPLKATLELREATFEGFEPRIS